MKTAGVVPGGCCVWAVRLLSAGRPFILEQQMQEKRLTPRQETNNHIGAMAVEMIKARHWQHHNNDLPGDRLRRWLDRQVFAGINRWHQ